MDKDSMKQPCEAFLNPYGMVNVNPSCPKCSSKMYLKPLKDTNQSIPKARQRKGTNKQAKPGILVCLNKKCGHRTQNPSVGLTDSEIQHRKKAIAESTREYAIETYLSGLRDYCGINDMVRARALARANKLARQYYNRELWEFTNDV